MNDILGVWIRIAIRSLEPVNLLAWRPWMTIGAVH
jgi:hypothetical protein